MMNNVKDNLQSNSSCTLITSGSYGEGRIMRDSDLDIMQVCNFAEVCEDTHMYFKPDTTYFEMEAEDTQPCFLRLRLRYFTGRSSFDDFLEKIGEGYYLSSAKFKQQLKDILLSTIHGPCISDKDGLCDLAYCLRSTVQVLPFNLISDNKSSYKQHKTRLSILLQNKHHDVVSGWLMLATLFYGIKQYYIALDILQYSLFKCSPEKLYQGVTVSNTQHELFNLDVFKNMTIAQLCKFMLLNVIDLVSIKPQEIPFEGEGRIYSFPPLVYTHFLLFLCHYHLKNTSKYLDSLRDLQITIEGNYFIGHAYEKYVSYNILGLSFQLSGDKESARRAFKQGLEFKPKNRCG
ncbi:unnamed protein product [Mytilus coruscus]|uniref:Uncharacterized protein n=1 Tax=Mytilus coruscus TaxID=42192 RepID=A0A6J8F0J3_MYTCO|nr:unnamed protein product [Mytilus coruscus]